MRLFSKTKAGPTTSEPPKPGFFARARDFFEDNPYKDALKALTTGHDEDGEGFMVIYRSLNPTQRVSAFEAVAQVFVEKISNCTIAAVPLLKRTGFVLQNIAAKGEDIPIDNKRVKQLLAASKSILNDTHVLAAAPIERERLLLICADIAYGFDRSPELLRTMLNIPELKACAIATLSEAEQGREMLRQRVNDVTSSEDHGPVLNTEIVERLLPIYQGVLAEAITRYVEGKHHIVVGAAHVIVGGELFGVKEDTKTKTRELIGWIDQFTPEEVRDILRMTKINTDWFTLSNVDDTKAVLKQRVIDERDARVDAREIERVLSTRHKFDADDSQTAEPAEAQRPLSDMALLLLAAITARQGIETGVETAIKKTPSIDDPDEEE